MENNLDELSIKLIDLSQDSVGSMPAFKMQHFVGDAQITDFSKVRQWLMELRTREDSLEQLEVRVERQKIEIELEEENLELIVDPKRKKLSELKIRDYKVDLRRFERSRNDAKNERDIILNLLKDFIANNQDSQEILEAQTNPVLREKYEKEYWIVRMAKQSMLDMINYGRISTGNLDAVLMMKPEEQRQVLGLASRYTLQVDSNVKELMTKASMNLPLPDVKEELAQQFKIAKSEPIENFEKLT